MTLDIMPVPRFISLSKREADIAIALERPQRGPYLCTKLADYSLRLYGTRDYLARHAPIRRQADLGRHTFIGYVDELLFSDRLRYLDGLVQPARVVFRSTSVLAQYQAALGGQALTILPCFLAAQDERLEPVLADSVLVTRSFWMYCHEDLRRTRRVMALWDYLKQAVALNRDLLHGHARELRTPPEDWAPSYAPRRPAAQA
jgi:DNA-binding transcriptional LysR family regulator